MIFTAKIIELASSADDNCCFHVLSHVTTGTEPQGIYEAVLSYIQLSIENLLIGHDVLILEPFNVCMFTMITVGLLKTLPWVLM